MWEDGSIWQGAREGVLLLRACADCGLFCHPPLPMCPHCQSLSWTQQAASGKAVLLSWLVSVHPGDADPQPRVVIVARLAEGVNFVSNLIGAPVDALHEGMVIELCFASSEDLMLPLFRPAGAVP
jgi:uncharacterized OB-fold protein